MSDLKFKLGADPEFNLELDGKKLDAGATIKSILQGNKEFKANKRGDGYDLGKFGDIGWDGHSSTGEIRPAAAPTPEGVVNNLKEIFEKFYKLTPNFQISTLSRYSPIGGHIHFELLDKFTTDGAKMNASAQAIHKRLMSFMLPITLGENKVNLMVRLRASYGEYCGPSNAYRVDVKFKKPNGTNGYTYELRSPSAEWLTTPKIAKATLAYLAVIFHEITENPKKFNKECKDIIIRTNQVGNAIQSLALNEYALFTKTVFNKIKKYVRKFELYEEYKEDIEYILNPNKILADKQSVNYDIKIGWGLETKATEAPRKEILSEKAFNKISKEKDIESLSKIYSIDYNNDLNVKTFVEILSQKMAAFNWKLNKQYFFFGIRKGIESYIVMDKSKKIIQGLEIAKTTSDKKAIDKIMNNMYDKYSEEYSNQEKRKLNFITGKIEKQQKDLIIIGIPYRDRVDLKTKKFIETVYNVDKNKIPKTIETKNGLIDDNDKPEKEKGEIYAIITNLEKEEKKKKVAVEANPEEEERTNRSIDSIANEQKEINEEADLLAEARG